MICLTVLSMQVRLTKWCFHLYLGTLILHCSDYCIFCFRYRHRQIQVSHWICPSHFQQYSLFHESCYFPLCCNQVRQILQESSGGSLPWGLSLFTVCSSTWPLLLQRVLLFPLFLPLLLALASFSWQFSHVTSIFNTLFKINQCYWWLCRYWYGTKCVSWL